MPTVDGVYGGGGEAGGKFRRKPFRKTEVGSTPYERPASAQRNRRGRGINERNGGWISKIIDPATRLISSGASMVFSSVFRKSDGAPTPNTTITLSPVHEIEDDQVTNLNSEVYVPDVIPGLNLITFLIIYGLEPLAYQKTMKSKKQNQLCHNQKIHFANKRKMVQISSSFLETAPQLIPTLLFPMRILLLQHNLLKHIWVLGPHNSFYPLQPCDIPQLNSSKAYQVLDKLHNFHLMI